MGEKRLPLLIKGSCHEVTEGIRTFLFPGTPCERNLTIPQSKIRDFCQLPLHKGAGVLPHQCFIHRFSDTCRSLHLAEDDAFIVPLHMPSPYQNGSMRASTPTGFFYAEIYPHPLWNVENLSVDNFAVKIFSTRPVESCEETHTGLWKKSGWGSKAKWSFPHKLSLILLILPFPMIE